MIEKRAVITGYENLRKIPNVMSSLYNRDFLPATNICPTDFFNDSMYYPLNLLLIYYLLKFFLVGKKRNGANLVSGQQNYRTPSNLTKGKSF